jgi:hypothetical protein
MGILWWLFLIGFNYRRSLKEENETNSEVKGINESEVH